MRTTVSLTPNRLLARALPPPAAKISPPPPPRQTVINNDHSANATLLDDDHRHLVNWPRRNLGMGDVVPAVMELLPLQVEPVPHHLHGKILDQVENELGDDATVLFYVDRRGEQTHFQTMKFTRVIGTLPLRQLFALKWIRMVERAGLLREVLSAHRHYHYVAGYYVAALNGDGKAKLDFTPLKPSRSPGEMHVLQEKCIRHYTVDFEAVYSEIAELVEHYNNALPGTPLAKYGRLHVGKRPSGTASR